MKYGRRLHRVAYQANICIKKKSLTINTMKIALRKYKQRPTLLDEADFTVVESHQNYNYIELLPVLVSLDASYLKCCKKGSKHTSYKSFVMTPSVWNQG